MASIRKSIAIRISQIAAKSRQSSSAASSTSPATHPTLLHRLLGGGSEEAARHPVFLQRRPVDRPAVPPDRLAERIRALNPARLQLDGLVRRPPAEAEPGEGEESMVAMRKIGLDEVKKVVWASRMEAARRLLRAAGKSCVDHPHFLRICCEAAGSELGPKIARSLDDSGDVVVLGNVVFLKPDEDRN